MQQQIDVQGDCSGGVRWLDEMAKALTDADRLCGRLAIVSRSADETLALRRWIRPVSAELEALRLRATIGFRRFG